MGVADLRQLVSAAVTARWAQNPTSLSKQTFTKAFPNSLSQQSFPTVFPNSLSQQPLTLTALTKHGGSLAQPNFLEGAGATETGFAAAAINM